MTKPTCSVDICEKESYLRGWCNAHYIRNQRYGDPLASAKIPTTEDRFWAKVDKTGTCWNWTGYVMPQGYGQFKHDGNLAHRYAYTLINGPIDDGVEIDHRCFNRKCVRPEHLRPATHKQNNEHMQGAQANNKSSGIRGVYPVGNRWEVKVGHNGRTLYVGLFATTAEAEVAAITKRNELFTHNDVDRMVS